jgi:hypothetical protein
MSRFSFVSLLLERQEISQVIRSGVMVGLGYGGGGVVPWESRVLVEGMRWHFIKGSPSEDTESQKPGNQKPITKIRKEGM